MKKIITNLLTLLVLVLPASVMAQTDTDGLPTYEISPGPTNNNNTGLGSGPVDIWTDRPDGSDRPNDLEQNDIPLNAPIDGGLGILLFAGVAYGAKKAIANKNAK